MKGGERKAGVSSTSRPNATPPEISGRYLTKIGAAIRRRGMAQMNVIAEIGIIIYRFDQGRRLAA